MTKIPCGRREVGNLFAILRTRSKAPSFSGRIWWECNAEMDPMLPGIAKGIGPASSCAFGKRHAAHPEHIDDRCSKRVLTSHDRRLIMKYATGGKG